MRWTAPERFDSHHVGDRAYPPTTESDMYSLGGVMYQVCSLCIKDHTYTLTIHRSSLVDHHIIRSKADPRFPLRSWTESSLRGHVTFIFRIIIGYSLRSVGYVQRIAHPPLTRCTSPGRKSSFIVHRLHLGSYVCEEPSYNYQFLIFAHFERIQIYLLWTWGDAHRVLFFWQPWIPL